MAVLRTARVLRDLSDNRPGALLAFQLEGHADVDLKGGRYIIIHTGLETADGKAVKRAYSIFAVKPEAEQFFLAAAPVPGGMASSYLQSLHEGDRLTFSGPWGRFHWPVEAQENKVLALAFGSGITGVLGYLASVPGTCPLELYWYKDASGGLLPHSMVQESLSHAKHVIHERSMTDDPLLDLERVDLTSRFVAAGEGLRIERCFQYLRTLGVRDEQMQSEIFYRGQDLSDAKADR